MRTCNLRKRLGVEQVRNKGKMMLWIIVFIHVLYVEDWQWMEQGSAFMHLPKNLYGEEKCKIKFRLAIFWI